MKKLLFVLALLMTAGLLFAGGAQEPADEPDYRIGIVFDVGGKGDLSFNDSAYEGLVRLAEDYNGFIQDDPDDVDHGDDILLKYLEPREGGQDREMLLRIMAEDGFDLVIGVGFAFTDSIPEVASDFPETHFGLIDGFVPDLDEDSNLTCLAFDEHEGSFLVGAVAGLVANDDPIGYIGGMDIPLIHKFHAGFFAGAMWTNPVLRDPDMLLGQYIASDPSGFGDPSRAATIATNMYNQGAEIIYHAAGASGTGLFRVARDMDRWAIGVDSDQGLRYAESDSPEEREIAEHILTSMIKRVDQAVYLTAQELIETGSVTGGYRSFGIEDAGVGVAINEYNEEVMEPFIPVIDELSEMIMSDEIEVPEHDDQLVDWALNYFE
ncbi:MAG: BMP family protein [Spirochaetia bacterium]